MARTKQVVRKPVPRQPPTGGKGSIRFPKSKPRRKPGALALREIKKYQNTGELLIPKAPFKRLVHECLQDIKTDARMTATAVVAIQEAAEAQLVMEFEHANLLAQHAHRKTIRPRDMALARLIRTDNAHDYVLGADTGPPVAT